MFNVLKILRKSSLQAEIEILRNEMKTMSQGPHTTMSEVADLTPAPSTYSQSFTRPEPVSPQTFSRPSATKRLRTCATLPYSSENLNDVASSKKDGVTPTPVLPRMLADVVVDANEINDCFCL